MSSRLLENRYGYFAEDGREFVVTAARTPRPWVNVVSNGDWSFIVSQTGSGFSWRGNAGQNRITRSFQDLVKDNWGKYLYIRDRVDGSTWSATWMPFRRDPELYEVRHGIGYSLFTLLAYGIRSELRLFVASGAPVELMELTLENRSGKERSLDVTSYFEWVLGHFPDEHREFHKLFFDSRFDETAGCLLVDKHLWGFQDDKGRNNNVSWPYTAFHASWPAPASFDSDKESFLGMYGDESAPAAMGKDDLARRVGRFTDPAASLRVPVKLRPGERGSVIFTIGAAEHGKEDARELAARYTCPEAARAAFRGVGTLWDGLLDAEIVKSPEESLDVMANLWLKYQAISGRLWALSGAYQVSAGYGFRDQLQDSLVYLPTRPELTRRQILFHAAHQFQEGDVRHWWLQIRGWGPRTKCSDDLLWLPYVTAAYLAETADFTILDEPAPFDDGGEASLYEHCRRSIERAFHRFSPRGIPLIGDNDWNDGLSAVGTDWKGESFWVGEFLYLILGELAPLASARGDAGFAAKCRSVAESLRDAVNRHGWDGEWYLQGTTDAGEPLGSRENEEGRIFLNPQLWAVISGIAPAERARAAMDAVTEHLLAENGALLLKPAYSRVRSDIGYITRYAPGLRENGGVYSHAATWAVWAYAVIGDAGRAWESFRRLLPPLRAAKDADRYVCEPYVMPGNSDGPRSPSPGKGGWTWYTGSAQWMHRVVTHWILGIRPASAGLVVDPLIPPEWPGFEYTRRFRGASYHIRVENPAHVSRGVAGLEVDGKRIPGNVVPDLRDGESHEVRVTLGPPPAERG